jgi:hypothetical protein
VFDPSSTSATTTAGGAATRRNDLLSLSTSQEDSNSPSPQEPTRDGQDDETQEQERKTSFTTFHCLLVQILLLKRLADSLVNDLQKNTTCKNDVHVDTVSYDSTTRTKQQEQEQEQQEPNMASNLTQYPNRHQDAISGKTPVDDDTRIGPLKSSYKEHQEKDGNNDWNRVQQNHDLHSTALSSSLAVVNSNTDQGGIQEHLMTSTFGLDDSLVTGPLKSSYKEDQEKDGKDDWNRVQQDYDLHSTALSSSLAVLDSTTEQGSNQEPAMASTLGLDDSLVAGPLKSSYKRDQKKYGKDDWNRVQQDHERHSTALSSSLVVVDSTTDQGGIKEPAMAFTIALEHLNQQTCNHLRLPGVERDPCHSDNFDDDAEHFGKDQFSQADQKEMDVRSMMQFPTTRNAWMIASQVSSIIHESEGQEETHPSQNTRYDDDDEIWGLQTLAQEDLFFLAQALMRLQADFRQAGKPTRVDLGFHYTKQENLSRIRTNGLVTKADRESRNIIPKIWNGSSYGGGVYTCSNHWEGVGGAYGNVGILVARLPGKSSVDCTIVDNRNIVVLKHSQQCLPLVLFPRWMIGSSILAKVQNSMMKIVNHFMNHPDDVVAVVVARSGKVETASPIVPSPTVLQGRLASSAGPGQQEDESGNASNVVNDRKEEIKAGDLPGDGVYFVTAKTLKILLSKGIYTGTLSKTTSLPHGKGRIEYIESKTGQWYEGDWIHGTPTGYGSLCRRNGDLYVGTFLQGYKHGVGVRRLDKKFLVGDFIRGQVVQGILTCANGDIYEGSWMDGKPHGRGKVCLTDGSYYEGDFRKGKMHASERTVGVSWKNGVTTETKPNDTAVHDVKTKLIR